MKIGMRQIHFFILLFAASSLLFHPPFDFEANATDAWYNDSWGGLYDDICKADGHIARCS